LGAVALGISVLGTSAAHAQDNSNLIVNGNPDTGRQLSDTQFAIHGTRGLELLGVDISQFQDIPSSIGVWEVCVGMNQASHTSITNPRLLPGEDGFQGFGGADLSADQQQQAQQAALGADGVDLLRRCADVIQAAGSGLAANAADEDDNRAAIRALDQIGPDEIAAYGTISTEAVDTQQNSVSARIRALQSGLGPQGGAQVAMRDGANIIAGSFMPSGGAAGLDSSKLGFFLSGTVSGGDKDASGREAGFDYQSLALTGGVDYQVSDNGFIGVALSYTDTSMDMDNSGGELESDIVGLSLYGSRYANNGVYFSGFANLSPSSHSSERRLNYTLDETNGGCCVVDVTGNTVTVDQTASGDTDGTQSSIVLDLGREFVYRNWTYGPSIGLAYTNQQIDGYRETMSNPEDIGRGLGLVYSDQDIESSKARLGFQAAVTRSMNWGLLSGQYRVDYFRELTDATRVIQATYINDPLSQPFSLRTEESDLNYGSIAFDVTGVFSNGKSAYLTYSTLVGLDNITYYGIQAGFRMKF
jgi:outer membrane autotransporter protein